MQGLVDFASQIGEALATLIPTFAYLAALHLSGTIEAAVLEGAKAAAALLTSIRRSRGGRVELLGPVAAPMAKVRGRYR